MLRLAEAVRHDACMAYGDSANARMDAQHPAAWGTTAQQPSLRQLVPTTAATWRLQRRRTAQTEFCRHGHAHLMHEITCSCATAARLPVSSMARDRDGGLSAPLNSALLERPVDGQALLEQLLAVELVDRSLRLALVLVLNERVALHEARLPV